MSNVQVSKYRILQDELMNLMDRAPTFGLINEKPDKAAPNLTSSALASNHHHHHSAANRQAFVGDVEARASSIASWSQSSSLSSGKSSECLDVDQCNSKEVESSYNTKFARYHLETYRQNDRLRWNFDFDHNRPLDDNHHHHHQTVARYQWEPV